jgi:hypothetical protein
MTPEQILQRYKPPQLTPRPPLNELCWTLHPKSKDYPRKVMQIIYLETLREFRGRWRIKNSPSGTLGRPNVPIDQRIVESVRQILPAEDLAACVAASVRRSQMNIDDIPF